MKRPYRAGDTFEIPIVGDRRARGIVLESGTEVATLALIGGPVARVHDRGLVLNRWPMTGRDARFVRAAWPELESRFVESPETFADRARALLDGAAWVRPRVRVHNGVLIEPGARAHVRTIVGKRTDVVDARRFADDVGLRVLDLAGVTLEHPEALADLPELRVLRLSEVRAGDDLAWLAATGLTHLYLHGAHRARSLEPLTRMPALRHLDIRDAWQFGLQAMDWKAAFGHLEAVTIDIGSRRKNAELYRCFTPPYPEPFERALARYGD